MVSIPGNFLKTHCSLMAMESSFRINQARSTRERGWTVSDLGMVAWFKIMDSFMRVNGVRTGLMVKAVSDTLKNQKIPNLICSVVRSINLQGRIGALYLNNRTKNFITAYGEMTAWVWEVLWNTQMGKLNWSIFLMETLILQNRLLILSPFMWFLVFRALPFQW